jgi:hypothetical protein
VRLGTFVLVFAVLLLLAAIIVPGPSNFDLPDANRAIDSAGTYPRCYSLHYEPPQIGVPTAIKLTGEIEPFYSHGRIVYATEVDSIEAWHAGWWLSLADSLDIAWHHSPVLRLPRHGPTLVGRGGWGRAGLLEIAFADSGFVLTAELIPCAGHRWRR